MKVGIIGDFTDSQLNEGLKNVAFHLAHELTDYPGIQILRVNNKKISIKTLRELKQYDPDVIHYVPGPTNASFILLRFLKLYLKRPKFFFSAPYPLFNDSVVKLINFKATGAFVASNAVKQRLDSLSFNTHILPNGVNVEKFTPVSDAQKKALRKKYGLQDKFTILHVGHLNRSRDLDLFTKLSTEHQIVVIASPYTEYQNDKTISDRLRASGCIVVQESIQDIEEYYQLSDCYVFPAQTMAGSILCPLSILEAMSCNLPVITTDQNGIETLFSEGDGLLFARYDKEFFDAIEHVKQRSSVCTNRQKVEKYTWKYISNEIAKIYLASFQE
jgi:glycosyltransferase involved in cell wall biosynthesis